MKDKKAYGELVMFRGYNTKLMEKAEGRMQALKFDGAYDRMLYCNVRGLEGEAQELFNKITDKVKELEL